MPACLLLLLPLASLPSAARADGFTPAQRAEIVAIVREALRTDPGILRDAVAALRSDDAAQEQRDAQAAIAASAAELAGAPGDPDAGNPKGDVTVTEFFDLRCPYCRQMRPTVAALLRDDPGVRLVYKDIPVLGPPSVLGARAETAARRQGGWQRLHDLLMAGPPDITADLLRQDAGRAGLDWAQLRQDMDDPSVQDVLARNVALARRLAIEGTPAYVVGDRLLTGQMQLADLQAAVAAARHR